MRYLRIFRYSDDLDTELRKIRDESREVTSLEGTPGSVIFRVKVEERARGLF